ncbi:MAG: glycosyltransferase family 4 protein [Deltaproteobacteria bacterium]|nr:glycosyltransferase family 4 protein [Deltaproteobacteria bacterium]
MRIALLVRRFDTKGGIGKSAVELSRALIARGHGLTVYAQKADPEIAKSLGSAFVRVAGPGFDPTLSMLWFARSTERLVEELRRDRSIDVTVGFDHSTLQDVFRLGGGVHAEFLEATRGLKPKPSGRMLDRIALNLERTRLRPGRFEKLVAVSQRGRQDVLKHYPAIDPGDVVVVRNGVDLSRFSATFDAEERARVRRSWLVDEGSAVALLVGQNPMMKGLDLAASAARAAGVRLVYVGGRQKERALLDSMGAKEVIWAGIRDDVPACYRAADVLIQPSRYENFGNVVLEAAASGLPAIAPDWFGASEVLRESGASELLVSSTGPDALAEKLTFALDPKNRPRLRAASMAAARSNAASFGRWVDEMESVITTARAPASPSQKPIPSEP